MEVTEFQLTSEYIELIKLLKLLGICESGADAKLMVEEGLINHENAVEYRKRKKLRAGDNIEIPSQNIKINLI